MRKRGFWNDPDGFSITDMLSLIVCGSYFILLLLITLGVMFGGDISQLAKVLDDIKGLVMLVLTGYFADQMTSRMKNSKDTEIVLEDIQE